MSMNGACVISLIGLISRQRDFTRYCNTARRRERWRSWNATCGSLMVSYATLLSGLTKRPRTNLLRRATRMSTEHPLRQQPQNPNPGLNDFSMGGDNRYLIVR